MRKGCQNEANGNQKMPKGAKGSQKGDKREPRGAKRVPKGNQREPNASQREPNASQRTTKMDQISMPEKRARPTLRNGSIVEPFLELKTFKSIEKQTLFLIFVVFGKVEKNKQFLELILDPFSKAAAPKTPTFRATAIAGLPADTLTQ